MTTPRCRQCGKPLREQRDTDWTGYDTAVNDGATSWGSSKRLLRQFTKPNGTYGYEGNGKFCTLRCGYRWAIKHV